MELCQWEIEFRKYHESYIGTRTKYNVFVTGIQVNHKFLNKKGANQLASIWQDKGHDVEIKKIIYKVEKWRKKKENA